MYTIDNSLLLGFGAEKRPERTSSGEQSGSSRFVLRDPPPKACGFGCGGADPMVDGGFGKRDPLRPGCGSGGGCVGQCEEAGETSCGKRGAKSFVDAGAMDWGIQLRDGGAIPGLLGGGGLGGAAGAQPVGPLPPAGVRVEPLHPPQSLADMGGPGFRPAHCPPAGHLAQESMKSACDSLSLPEETDLERQHPTCNYLCSGTTSNVRFEFDPLSGECTLMGICSVVCLKVGCTDEVESPDAPW